MRWVFIGQYIEAAECTTRTNEQKTDNHFDRGGVEDIRLEAKDKKNPEPRTQKNSRPRTAFPRTDPLEAKDRNARGQGPRTQPQVFSKKKVFKKVFQTISDL